MSKLKFDLIVVGAGVAGIAGAIAAARRGLRVVLLEKTLLTGGLATGGNVNIYLPLCDGNGTQVSFGITAEMLHNSLRYGPGEIPGDWNHRAPGGGVHGRYQAPFAPASFTLALDEMLEEAGVELWLDTVLIGVRRENRHLTAVEVFNKSGRLELEGSYFIDATGDADLALLAQLPCRNGANALASWTLEYRRGAPGLAEHCTVEMRGFADAPETYGKLDGRLVSEFVLEGRRLYRQELAADYAAGRWRRSSRFPLALPTVADLRHTRSVVGRFTLEDGMEWRRFEDSIGLAADWRRCDSVWEIPYRTLLSGEMDNVLWVGRCLSASGDAWEVTRVIPAAALTGEAGGVAVALAQRNGTTPGELPVELLQQELRERSGFAIHYADLSLVPPSER